MTPGLRGLFLTSAKCLVSAGLLIWLLSSAEIGEALATLDTALLPAFGIACLLLMLQSPIVGLRWYTLLTRLGHHGFERGWCVVVSFIGTFFNQCLPSSVGGDAYRVMAARKGDLTWSTAGTSVLIDRFSGVVAIALMASLSLPIVLPLIGDSDVRWGAAIMTTGILAACIGLPLAAWAIAQPWCPSPVQRFAGWGFFGTFLPALHRTFTSRSALMALLALGTLANILNGMATAVLADAIGIELPFFVHMTVISLALLATIVPISLAGWGVREGVVVFLYSGLGIPASDALLTSLLFGVAMTLSGLPGAILFVLKRRRQNAGASS